MTSGPAGYCIFCGTPQQAGDRFCRKCGQSRPADEQPSSPADVSIPSALPGGVPWSPARFDPSAQPPPENGGHYLSPFDQKNPPPYTSSPPTAPRRRRGRVVALAVTGVVVAAAATGATVFFARSHTTPQAAAGGGAAPVSYASFEAEYPATKGAIARINTIGCTGSPSVGTGFAIDAQHIVTAGHVIEGANTMTVTLDGNPVPARIVGLDSSGDVALLQSDSPLPGPYIPLGDSAPGVGERVAAIGFPLGAGLTLTQGSVSAVGQNITVNNNQLAGLVQTDTALNPGNSGGPLIALDGTARGIVDALNTKANATGYAIAPQYAHAEVQRWIATPESHPLPLCNAPSPYVAAGVPAPSAQSPTTTPSAPSPDRVQVTESAASAQAPAVLAISQRYYNAINAHDYDAWTATVTSQRASQQSRASWNQGYRSTHEFSVVVTAITPTGADSATVAMSFVSTQDPADAPTDLPVTRICWQTQLPVTHLGTDARIGTSPSGPQRRTPASRESRPFPGDLGRSHQAAVQVLDGGARRHDR